MSKYSTTYQIEYRKRPYVKARRAIALIKYRNKNREKVRAWARKSVAKSRMAGKGSGLIWYYKNKVRASKLHRDWNLANKDWVNQYAKNRLKSNPRLKLRARLGSRIRDALKNNCKKTGRLKTQVLLGCSTDQLRQHLESLWKPDMSWDNYGFRGWHVDHIRPCASFDLTNTEQQKQCFHFTNLQPLWMADNLSKSDKYEP